MDFLLHLHFTIYENFSLIYFLNLQHCFIFKRIYFDGNCFNPIIPSIFTLTTFKLFFSTFLLFVTFCDSIYNQQRKKMQEVKVNEC